MAASSLSLSVLIQRTGGSDNNILYGPKEIAAVGQNPGKFADFSATLLPSTGNRLPLVQVGNISNLSEVMSITIINEGETVLVVGTDLGLMGGGPTTNVIPLFEIPIEKLLHIPCTSTSYGLFINNPDPAVEGRCRIIVEALPTIS